MQPRCKRPPWGVVCPADRHMRSYIVIPEGTSIVRVHASTPHFAASKARRGKGERVDVAISAVLPLSAAIEVTDEGPQITPGQLRWDENGEAVDA